MVKNIPYSVKEQELKELFGRYGSLKKCLLSPYNTLGIVEYENERSARIGMKKLSYHNINYIMPLYLEYAPIDLIKENPVV